MFLKNINQLELFFRKIWNKYITFEQTLIKFGIISYIEMHIRWSAQCDWLVSTGIIVSWRAIALCQFLAGYGRDRGWTHGGGENQYLGREYFPLPYAGYGSASNPTTGPNAITQLVLKSCLHLWTFPSSLYRFRSAPPPRLP